MLRRTFCPVARRRAIVSAFTRASHEALPPEIIKYDRSVSALVTSNGVWRETSARARIGRHRRASCIAAPKTWPKRRRRIFPDEKPAAWYFRERESQ